MSAPHHIQIKISHAPTSEPTEWFTKTQHDKASNRTTVYLFQRAENKPSLGRSISDFFNGIRPASDKANKHLHHAFSHLTLGKESQSAGLANVHTRCLQEIAKDLGLRGKYKPQLGFDTHSGIQTGELKINVLSEAPEKLKTKQRLASTINSIYDPDRWAFLPKNFPDKEKVIRAINYAIDIESNTAIPKSKADIRALSEHLDRLLLLVEFNEDDPLLEQLQTMYTTLEKHSK